MKIARRFSVTNFLIASSALAFQVMVLYPWHNRLDDDFRALRQDNLRLMDELRQFTKERTKEKHLPKDKQVQD